MISEENIFRPRMSATAQEYVPNVLNDKNANNERKAMD